MCHVTTLGDLAPHISQFVPDLSSIADFRPLDVVGLGHVDGLARVLDEEIGGPDFCFVLNLPRERERPVSIEAERDLGGVTDVIEGGVGICSSLCNLSSGLLAEGVEPGAEGGSHSKHTTVDLSSTDGDAATR